MNTQIRTSVDQLQKHPLVKFSLSSVSLLILIVLAMSYFASSRAAPAKRRTQQQREIAVLTVSLKDQAAQIQKVSAHVEPNRPVPVRASLAQIRD